MRARAWLTDAPLAAADVLAQVGSEEDGAVSLFLGTVRRSNAGRAVASMHYDAYRPMAERVLHDIVQEALERLGDGRVAAAHRLGEVTLGEASVAIAASSPHRAEAFDACRYVIEAIKVRLPVWKLERYVDGTEAWLDGSPPQASTGTAGVRPTPATGEPDAASSPPPPAEPGSVRSAPAADESDAAASSRPREGG